MDAGMTVGEEGGEVDQVLAVPPDLLDRVEHGLPVLRDRDETVVAEHCVRPLLELDQDVGVVPCRRVNTAQHHVDPFRAEWQQVLEEDLDVLKPGFSRRPSGRLAGCYATS